ncbi:MULTISPECIES: tRNA adenosine(34) deaminase TadA [unclassified Arsukibacterium]|uniref:tRNA adenosine(34) deaminase TadA n=1 Tax=unclassified Arsukibacterium TaxID=2635278 RepID=UPI000C4A6344|nr:MULTISPECIES: tRNA adenosine(34) deaminase TadA [unclassified Arsukibacterium]MAA93844.1 tRNA adenosine(34) deaminase TadA [Rheinheimera sp.]MBM34398.1 tRNA adenosine(34) deaminase TadA [Rheinheimera sp.]HAW92076.1 tRNA adenosine(34) deaminase TadA [Candidatus Azambacteria bacterium]|tara:strand:+ start:1219 stop:1761 length:543 start_codon:yes stop_codon:yes gene_type:complete
MTDQFWMDKALQLASRAEQAGEVPVGAVIVKDGRLIAEGYNQMISLNDPSAHAEMQAVRQAGQYLQNYRLSDCTLYVTLEPCSMCAGMLVHSRLARLVFGASDYKTGAAGSIMNLVQHPQLNHQLEVTGGVMAEQCAASLSAFFQRRRREKKAAKQPAAKPAAGNATGGSGDPEVPDDPA